MGLLKRLGKEQILNAADIKPEEVNVPEWGGTVLVRGMSGTERDDWEKSRIIEKGKGRNKERDYNLNNFKASFIVRCIVDDGGKRLFSDDDIIPLGRKSALAIERVFKVASRLSGMTDEDIEELAEGLEATRSGD